MNKSTIKIAVVGATGNVGRVMLNVLAERGFKANQVKAIASNKSTGKKVSFGDDDILIVEDLKDFDFSTVDVGLFSPGGKVSAEYAPKAAKAGCTVIDNTSFFRQDPKIPLIIPEVNPESISNYKNKNIIANPNCALVPIAAALKPLSLKNIIKRIVVSTYQSVSGAGKEAMEELDQQTRSLFTGTPKPAEKLTRPIAYNLIPHIGAFTESGYTEEEIKMSDEIKKILDPRIELSSTCVRVPVFVGHCSTVHVEFEKPFLVDEAMQLLQCAPGIQIMDAEDPMDYATPLDVVGQDDILISRLRQDMSTPNGLVFWVVSDNLRKGAALNAVQILELLIEYKNKQKAA
ncbi:MAG: aspartate-semialdehyde dehydrogenase [Pseudomonadota bacterium]|jgi:aspartate-semialdehyde dehydrogenase|nr:aspartate-semialdehyde dehydrogenase [Alphaproteobacteria bacterium]